MGHKTLKSLLEAQTFIYAPGVFDMMSLLLAEQRKFSALYFSGYWNAASSLGLPDVGLATYRDFITQIANMTASSDTPLIADADTGFGGLINIDHTVKGYEAAGVSAIQLEDQVSPKKCGHQPGKQVVDEQEMVTKIKVAIDARKSEEFLIIARTDARDIEGLGRAIERAKTYRQAGADITFVEGPRSETEMGRICKEIPAPQMVNMAHGSKTPILSKQRLEEIGYAIAIIPSAAPLAALRALNDAYDQLQAGNTDMEDQVDLYDFDEFCDEIGFPKVRTFEKKWAK